MYRNSSKLNFIETSSRILRFRLMTSDFTAAAILITFGAVLGKASRLQLFVMAVIECIFFAINEAIILEFLHISDVGGSIVVHLFGAYFGLAVATVCLLYTSPSPRDGLLSRMPSSA